MSRPRSTKTFSFLKSKLAIRLSLYIFGIALASTLLLGAYQAAKSYQEGKETLRKEFQEIEKENLPSIEENLWILNIDSLKTILKGMLQKRNFVYFKLTDERGKTLVEVGRYPTSDFLVEHIPLYHRDAYGKKVYLGTLTLVATTRYIYRDVINNTANTLMILFATMLLVAFFISLLVWFFISRHLYHIQDYTKKIRFDQEMPPLKLDRKENFWTRNDVLTSLVDTFNGMQKLIHRSYRQLEYQSLHEPLCDLPNRRSLNRDLFQRIRECEESGKYAALFFIDLDFFKVLNDSLGHAVGDKVLMEVANRLRCLKEKNLKVYRLGGDEFLVLTQPLASTREEAYEKAEEIAKEIQSLFEKEIFLQNRTIKITASIGIEMFRDTQDVETIIKHADNALYHAKEEGRNKYSFFREQMQTNADKRLELEQLLHQVIERDQLLIYFQPKFDSHRKIRSAETLIRMKDKDGKMIPPGEFIPLAQETGLILELDRQVVRKVFQFIRENRTKIESSSLESIAINISPNQFIMTNFPKFIIAEAKKFEIDPHCIILEITEEAVVSNVEYALETMLKLKRHGFKFSIDDFGTGYSSLRYLINFPLDELKIDKTFIDHILEDQRYVAVIQTVIILAQNLHLHIVAEGVETPEQLQAILRYGDVLIQGYLFSPPLPKEKFLESLEER